MLKSYNLFGSSLFAVLALPILFGVSNAFADNDTAVDDVTINVPIACTLSGVGMNTHNATVNSGTLASNIGTTTIKAVCNDTNGFAIYAIGYTDDTYGKNVLTSSANGSSSDIATGTGTSGNSQWAMKLATDGNATYPITIQNGFDSSSYHTVPDDFTLVAKRTAGTDMGTSATGSTLTSTYQAYISSSQPAGTYSGQVLYALVHPHTASAPPTPKTTASGKICYYANASDAVGTMGCQTIPASGTTADTVTPTSATLLASNFSRTGYGFAGWSDAFDYATNPNAHFYGPQETITYTNGQYSGSNKGLSLYAVWIKSAGNLQDTTKVTELCGTNGTGGSLTTAPTDGTANLNSVSALTDQRDNQAYAIARLADGKCWMIENLRLENTNLDNSTGALSQGYNSSFVGLAEAESNHFTYYPDKNSLYSTDGSTTKTISGNNQAFRFPRYNNNNTQSRASNPTTNTVAMYSYGNYYTWRAAIADTTYYDSGDHNTTSICPTGWRLPTGGSAYASDSTSGINVTGDISTFRDFYNLSYKTMDEVKTAYEDTADGGRSFYSSDTTNTVGKTATKALRSFPNNFLYSGNYGVDSANNRGVNGNYWTSSARTNASSYAMEISSSVHPGTFGNSVSVNGYSIRCITGS